MAEPAPSTKRVVWVLGAGFSAPLGGPLLTQLLSNAAAKDILVRYPKDGFPKLHEETAFYVRGLYQRGTTNDLVRLSNDNQVYGEKMWSNAEDFIDYIDTASEPRTAGVPNHHAQRICRILNDVWQQQGITVDVLRATARRLIAAECCAFLEGVDVSREQWAPFRDWERNLGARDTVITFNYDRVLEMLIEDHNRRAREGRLPNASAVKVIRAGHEEDMGESRLAGCCPLLKLHGSVDWKLASENPPNVELDKPTFALDCHDAQLAIATPGPSKLRTTTFFGDLWKYACDAVHNADVVVFIGYRFPETDAYTSAELLGAIRASSAGKPEHHLSLHVVLGGHREHTERLAALLHDVCLKSGRQEFDPGYAIRSFKVHKHPLFAQDFVTVAIPLDL